MDNINKIIIEQKLETPARFLFFAADDACVFLAPVFVGFLGKALIEGFVCAFILFFLWRRIKGEGGLERFKAASYWYVPHVLTPFKSFPPSSVVYWRG